MNLRLKRTLSLLLALVMVLGMLPAPAWAADPQEVSFTKNQTAADRQTAGYDSQETIFTIGEGVTYTAQAGVDIAANSKVTVRGEGKVVANAATGNAITVKEGATFTVAMTKGGELVAIASGTDAAIGGDGTITLGEGMAVLAGDSEAEATDVTDTFAASHPQKWVKAYKAVNVTYNANYPGSNEYGDSDRGTVPVDSTHYAYDSKVTVLDNTGNLKCKNSAGEYTFDGWNTKADGTGTAYVAGAELTITEDTTLYAQWKLNDHKHGEDDYATEWTSTDTLPDAAGSYYLSGDVTLSTTWEAPDGVKLCLNGKTVTLNGEGPVISVPSGKSLTVVDEAENKGVITHATGKAGNGVDVRGTFSMTGGSITGNNGDYGGGVRARGNATVTLDGVNVTGNSANTNGGGVSVAESATLNLGGAAKVTGNKVADKANNVFLNGNAKINVSGKLGADTKVGVTSSKTDNEIIFTTNFDESGNKGSEVSLFESDNEDYSVVGTSGGDVEAKLTKKQVTVTLTDETHDTLTEAQKTITLSTGESLQSAGVTLPAPTYAGSTFEGWFNGDTQWAMDTPVTENVTLKAKWTDIVHEHNGVRFTAWPETNALPDAEGNYYLTGDVTLSDTWKPSGNVKLCLNGKRIVMSADGNAIEVPVGAELTVYANEHGSGAIAHSNGKTGRGVLVKGTFLMVGGSITDNSAEENGAGVGVSKTGTATLDGVSITGNTTTKQGGGVYAAPNSTLNVKGAVVVDGNKANGKNNNVYLPDGVKMKVTGALTGGTIGVTSGKEPANGVIFTEGFDDTNNGENLSVFQSDNTKYVVAPYGKNVEAMFGDETFTVTFEVNGGKLADGVEKTQTVVLNGNATLPEATREGFTLDGWYNGETKWSETTPVTEDVTLTAKWVEGAHTHDNLTFRPWEGTTELPTEGNWYLLHDVDLDARVNVSKNLNLCLNGHKITSYEKSDAAIAVLDGKTLAVYDDQGTGSITGKGPRGLTGANGTTLRLSNIAVKGFGTGVEGKESLTLELGGKLSIIDNEKNVVLASGEKITVVGALTGSQIGVSSASATGGADVTITDGFDQFNKTGDVSVFQSESQDYGVALTDDNEVELAYHTYTVTLDNNGHGQLTDAEKTQTVPLNGNANLPTLTEDGWNFKGWFDSEDKQWTDTTQVKADVNLTAKWEAVGHKHSNINYQPWSATDSLPTSGDYYLQNNVTLSAPWTPSGDVNLCLNGKTITYDGADAVSAIVADGTKVSILANAEGEDTGVITMAKGRSSRGVNVKNGGAFTMAGGSITGFSGLSEGGAVLVQNDSTATLDGVSITGNSATATGGGVSVKSSATLNIQGALVVDGNKAGEENSNVLLASGVKMTVTGALTGSKIGVTSAKENANGEIFTKDFDTYNNGEDLTVFQSDLEKYVVAPSGKNVEGMLSEESFTVTFDVNGGKLPEGTEKEQKLVKGEKVTLPEATREGYTLDGWYNGDKKWTESDTVSEDVTLTAKWTANAHSHDGLTFLPWEGTTELPAEGNWYLLHDVVLEARVDVNQNLNLCLNGHKVTSYEKKDAAIAVLGGKTLAICDDQGTGSIEGKGPRGLTGADGTTLRLSDITIKDFDIGVEGKSALKLEMAGKLTIIGNEKNVVLASGEKITVVGALTGSQIGVSSASATGTDVVVTDNFDQFNKNEDVNVFRSEHDDYGIALTDDDEVKLAYHTFTVTLDNGGHGAALTDEQKTQTVPLKGHPVLPALTEEGWELVGWYDGENNQWTDTTEVKGNTALTAVWKPIKHEHNGISFLPWKATDSLPASGNYYLLGDVTLSSRVDANGDDLNLCLNGHKITSTASGDNVAAFGAVNGATLGIYDDLATGSIEGTCDRGFATDGKSGLKLYDVTVKGFGTAVSGGFGKGLEIGGKVNISENTVNVLLKKDQKITVGADITGAKVGVISEAVSTETDLVIITDGLDRSSSRPQVDVFQSDDSNYYVVATTEGETEAALTSKIATITLNDDGKGGLKDEEKTVKVAFGATYTPPANLEQEGYTFKGWFVNDEEWLTTTPVTENVTLTAKWEPVAHEHDGVKQFMPWDKTDALPDSGDWYLLGDVKVSATVEVSGTLNLCLNGKNISYTGSEKLFHVGGGKTLMLCDNEGAGEITPSNQYQGAGIVVENAGTVNLLGGYIHDFGTGVYVDNGASIGVGKNVSVMNNGAKLMTVSRNVTADASLKQRNIVLKGEGKINILDKLTAGNLIGFTLDADQENADRVVTQYLDAEGATDDINQLLPDNKSLIVVRKNHEAVLAAPEIVISLELNGGAFEDENQKVQYPVAVGDKLAPDAKPVKTGFVFDGWYYQDGTAVGNATATRDTASTTLYAKWLHQHDGVTFQPWEATDSLPAEGSYYLVNDVTVSNRVDIADGKELNLCLNGKTITHTGDKAVFKLIDSGKLTVFASEEGEGSIVRSGDADVRAVNVTGTDSVFTMVGGTVSGFKEGVNVAAGTFRIKGKVTLTDNTSNVILADGKVITVAGSVEGSAIGVSVAVDPQPGSDVTITEGLDANGMMSKLDVFTSENTDYSVIASTDNKEAVLTVGYHTVHFEEERIPAAQRDKKVPLGDSVEQPTVERLDYSIEGWYTEATLSNKWDFTKPVKENLVLYPKWVPASHIHADEQSFLPWESATSLPDTGDAYYLTQDVVLDQTWTITGTQVLCLNKHTITMKEEGAAINVASGTTLYLYDEEGDGVITHAEGVNGMGIQVSGGKLFLDSVTVSGNTVTNENLAGGITVTAGGELTMTNGAVVTENSGVTAGGIYVGNTGKITVDGLVTVDKNTAGGQDSNLYLRTGKRIAIAGLDTGSIIGVTTESAPTEGSAVVITDGLDLNAEVGQHVQFISDNKDYTVIVSNEETGEHQEAVLAVGFHTVSFDVNSGTAESADQVADRKVKDGDTINEPTGVTRVGFNLKGWYLEDDKWEFNKPVTASMTLKAEWEAVQHVHDGQNYMPWASDTQLPAEPGYYYLTKDVNLSETWNVGADVVLCLNGKNITADGDFDAISVTSGVTLTVINPETDAVGQITRTEGTSGAGVRVEGTLILDNGVITGHTSGGVGVKGGTFTMNGGSVTGNSSNDGGGVSVTSAGTLNLYGGSISGNTATGNGADVYVGSTGKFHVKGEVTAEQVYLNGESKIIVDDKLHVSSAFTVDVSKTPTPDAPVVITEGLKGNGTVSQFTAANSAYVVTESKEGEAQIAQPTVTVSFVHNNGGENFTKTAVLGGHVEKPADPYVEGYVFDGWFADGAAESWQFETAAVTGDMTLTGHWHQEDSHTHDDISFKPWTESRTLPTEPGNYYLYRDVILTEPWQAPAGKVNLCLNGFAIKIEKNKDLIHVGAGAELNIYDHYQQDEGVGFVGQITRKNGTTGDAVVVEGGKFTLFGGNIAGHKTGINIQSGEASVYGGIVENNKTGVNNLGKFSVKGTFTIDGNEEANVWLANNKKVVVDGLLNSDTRFGITTETEPTGKTIVLTSGLMESSAENKNDDSRVFYSDKGFSITPTDDEMEAQIHAHQFQFAVDRVDKNVIVATCVRYGRGCDIDEGIVKLTLNASDAVYNAQPVTATLSDNLEEFNTKTKQTASATDIKYYDEGGNLLSGAPVDAGTYTAKLTVDTATAEKTFTISPKPVKLVWDADPKVEFDGKEHSIGVAFDPGFDVCSVDKSSVDLVRQGDYKATNAGAYTATAVLSGSKAGNYTLGDNPAQGKLTIKQLRITVENGVNWEGGEFTYDGKPHAPEVTITNAVDNYPVKAVLKFYDENDNELPGAPTKAGTYKASIADTDNPNYKVGSVMSQQHNTFIIHPAPVTVTGIAAQDKVYDGNKDAQLKYTDVVITGKITGDDLTVTAKGEFADKNVGQNKEVTISDITLTGADKDNYVLADTGNQTTAKASITPLEIKVTGIKAADKYYTGGDQTVAALDYTGAVFTTKLGEDDLGVTAKGTFVDENNNDTPDGHVGKDKKVLITDLTLTGTDAGNYKLSEDSQKVARATISPAEVTVKAADIHVDYREAKADLTGSDLYTVTVNIDGDGNPKGAYVNGELNVTLSTEAKQGSPVGAYELKVSVAENPDYKVTAITAKNYYVDAIPAQVTLTDTAVVYDGKPHGLTIKVDDKPYKQATSSLDVIDLLSTWFMRDVSKEATAYFSTTTELTPQNAASAGVDKLSLKDVGVYTVYYCVMFPNYYASGDSSKPAYVCGKGTVTITPRPVDITWGNTSFVYNGNRQIPAVTLSNAASSAIAAGVVAGDTVNAIVGTAQVMPGTYTATISGLTNGNYKLSEQANANKSTQFFIDKAKQAAPAAPKLVSRTVSSVKVASSNGAVYAIYGGKSWQKTGTFGGLKTNTKYAVYARMPETATHYASPAVKSYVATKKLTDTNELNRRLVGTANAKQISFKWGKVENADSYLVYAAYCGDNYPKKPVFTTKNNSTLGVVIKKLNGKPLNPTGNYKLVVKAVKNGKVIATSLPVHIAGVQSKHTNPRVIAVKNNSFSLKVGKSVKITASQTLMNKRLPALTNSHCPIYRYTTSDPTVATVNQYGKIVARGKGTCYVFVHARNGINRPIVVTVK